MVGILYKKTCVDILTVEIFDLKKIPLVHGKKVNRNVISCINAVSSSNFRGDLEILASNLKGESG